METEYVDQRTRKMSSSPPFHLSFFTSFESLIITISYIPIIRTMTPRLNIPSLGHQIIVLVFLRNAIIQRSIWHPSYEIIFKKRRWIPQIREIPGVTTKYEHNHEQKTVRNIELRITPNHFANNLQNWTIDFAKFERPAIFQRTNQSHSSSYSIRIEFSLSNSTQPSIIELRISTKWTNQMKILNIENNHRKNTEIMRKKSNE